MAALGIKNKRKTIIASLAGVLLLCVGFLAGFYLQKHLAQQRVINAGPPADEHGDGQAVQILSRRDGTPDAAALMALKELPPPWTQQGRFMARGESSGGAVQDLYTWSADARLITEQLTVAFLQRLQQHLANNGVNVNLTSSRNMTEILDMFEGVARDVLSYLRSSNSKGLLPLLRQFATHGTVTLSDVDPDVFRDEVFGILNLTRLGEWYSDTTNRHPAMLTRPPAAWNAAGGGAATEQLLTGSTNNRRLLAGADQRYWHRHLAAAGTGARVGARIPAIVANESATMPVTVSPVMSLLDMLCAIRSYSPTALQGLTLPPGNYSDNPAFNKGGPIRCPPRTAAPLFRYGKTVFKPVKIPVVFHCQRFQIGNTLHPPMWKPELAAQNLIDVTNKFYNGTNIQFTLKAVRYDPVEFPYLLLGSLKDWQACTGNPAQEEGGFPCLQETARYPAVASLAEKYVINVFIGGAQSAMYCNGTKEEACSSVYLGFSGAIGPWFGHPSPSWSEDSPEENWVFMTWDMFSPDIKNDYRFWDGGAVTLAHEVGHYLGLRHTHEGERVCEGDGIALGDAVPDTPVNKQTVQWAADKGLAPALARWCSEFRIGKKPQIKQLFAFSSCEQDANIDNVFNVESYLPDSCCMMFSPNQIARLHWAIASFRPKMMAAYAV